MRYSPRQILLAKEREQGRRSLVWFIRNAWPLVERTEYKHNWHIDLIAAHLEAVTRGELRKLIINIPPGSMKSLSVCVFWSVWQWIIHPSLAQLFTSFDISLTTRDADRVKTILTSEWFLERWGHKVRIDPSEPVRDFQCYDARGQFTGGWRYSTSVGGKTTGRHPDVRVIDDPTKPKGVTKQALEDTKLWWQNTMRSRARDPSTVATVLIMQRLAEEDLAGYFLSTEKDWTHVSIPLEFDSSRRCVTPYGMDPRKEEGESFWSERFTLEVIRAIKRETPDVATWSAQYDQNPTPPGGNVFKVEWLGADHRWTTLPDGGTWAQSWDFSFTGESSSDWVVGQVWLSVGSKHYLVDQTREKADFSRSLQLIQNVTEAWPKTVAKLVEYKANGPAIVSALENKVSGLVKIKVSDSKVARARAVAPLLEAGNVLLPASAPFLLELEQELLSFPRGKHDDQCDAMTQYLNWVTEGASFDYEGLTHNWRKALGLR